MEFRMQTDLAQMQGKELAFNFEELEKSLRGMTAKYAGLIVTEDGIAEAKRDRAELNRMSKALNDAKIRVKKAWMEPYTAFEAKCKRLIALCTAPSEAIDAQIKAFEEKEKAEKKALLKAHFAQCAGEAAAFIAYEDVHDPKWLNRTVALEEAYAQMDEALSRYREDVQSLAALVAGCEAGEKMALESAYRATRSVAAAVKAKAEIARIREAEAQRKAEADALCGERARKEAAIADIKNVQSGESCEAETVEVRFFVRGTAAQLAQLKAFLQENGMVYGRA